MFSGVKWGTDPIEDVDAQGVHHTGRQINLLDEQSGILVHVPFSGEALRDLVGELAQGLTDDQRRELAPSFTSGIVLPGLGSNPAFQVKANGRGPQG